MTGNCTPLLHPFLSSSPLSYSLCFSLPPPVPPSPTPSLFVIFPCSTFHPFPFYFFLFCYSFFLLLLFLLLFPVLLHILHFLLLLLLLGLFHLPLLLLLHILHFLLLFHFHFLFLPSPFLSSLRPLRVCQRRFTHANVRFCHGGNLP